MISKEAFLERVRTEAFPKLLQTEKDRKKILFKGLALFALGSYIFYWGVTNGLFFDWFLLVASVVCVNVAFFWIEFIQKQKSVFTPLFLQCIGNISCGQKRINRALLQHCLLFSNFTSSAAEDEFSGIFLDTTFSISEQQLVHGEGRDGHTVFDGIVIEIPMPKTVSGYTLLFNRKWPDQIPGLQKVKLEDSDLTHAYQIFSTDQIEARTLLTPAFMERLSELKKYFKGRIDVSFFGNHVVFAIRTHRNLFEPYSLFRPVTNTKTYGRFYDEIRAIYEMIQTLKINNANLVLNKNAHLIVDQSVNEKLYNQISSDIKLSLMLAPPLFLFGVTVCASVIIFSIIMMIYALILYS